jgi:hypothetical protein
MQGSAITYAIQISFEWTACRGSFLRREASGKIFLYHAAGGANKRLK